MQLPITLADLLEDETLPSLPGQIGQPPMAGPVTTPNPMNGAINTPSPLDQLMAGRGLNDIIEAWANGEMM